MPEPTKIAVVSASLKPASLSRVMARYAAEVLKSNGVAVDFIDLQEVNLPLCDAGSAYGHPITLETQARFAAVDGILVAVPIYNYSINAALKNLVELTGSKWEGKVVGFLNAAGAGSSYMSVMGLASSLMLDFRCVVVPRFVYATSQAFTDERITDEVIAGRIEELSRELVRFTQKLKT